MSWPDLGEPRPRPVTRAYAAAPATMTGPSLVLPRPPAGGLAFDDVLERRRTCREFRQIDRGELLQLLGYTLWWSARVQQSLPPEGGAPRSLRPAPSAGAVHPVHIVVQLPQESAGYRYDPARHALAQLPMGAAVTHARRAAEQIYPACAAALLLFIAEPGLTAARYEAPESLVWRDAGVLQGVMAVAAAATGAGFSLLGLTGDAFAAGLIGQRDVHGVGMAYLGAAALR
jgi:hypothetical protein